MRRNRQIRRPFKISLNLWALSLICAGTKTTCLRNFASNFPARLTERNCARRKLPHPSKCTLEIRDEVVEGWYLQFSEGRWIGNERFALQDFHSGVVYDPGMKKLFWSKYPCFSFFCSLVIKLWMWHKQNSQEKVNKLSQHLKFTYYYLAYNCLLTIDYIVALKYALGLYR